jgi:hypothetical protein
MGGWVRLGRGQDPRSAEGIETTRTVRLPPFRAHRASAEPWL